MNTFIRGRRFPEVPSLWRFYIFRILGWFTQSCGFSSLIPVETGESLTLTQICLFPSVCFSLFLLSLQAPIGPLELSLWGCFWLSTGQGSPCFAFVTHAEHVTNLINSAPLLLPSLPLPWLFQMNKSDWVNAITWVNEWFLKDWTRPNTTLRVKLIIAANSKEERGGCGACVHFVRGPYFHINLPHLGIWDRGPPVTLLW